MMVEIKYSVCGLVATMFFIPNEGSMSGYKGVKGSSLTALHDHIRSRHPYNSDLIICTTA